MMSHPAATRLAISTMGLLLCVGGAARSASDAPANVLFIYVEDLGYYTSERAARAEQPHRGSPNPEPGQARGGKRGLHARVLRAKRLLAE